MGGARLNNRELQILAEDENEYEIWLPVFSENTWKIYNTDD